MSKILSRTPGILPKRLDVDNSHAALDAIPICILDEGLLGLQLDTNIESKGDSIVARHQKSKLLSEIQFIHHLCASAEIFQILK